MRFALISLMMANLVGGTVYAASEETAVPRAIVWREDAELPGSGPEKGSGVVRHLDLTELHDEPEYTRNAQWVDVNNDGKFEIVTRTLNENRVRVLNGKTGATIHLTTQPVTPAEGVPMSQMAVGDIDEDNRPDAVIGTYHGDVMCFDLVNGSLKWHRKLDYHINNPRLEYADITPGKGLNFALTVGNDFKWTDSHSRPRINFVRNPNLIVLNADGTTAWLVEKYDKTNGNGHNVWTYDIDADGLHEIAACGNNKVVWFDNDGTRLFDLPVTAGGHPDHVEAYDLLREHTGVEIIYLDDIHAIGVANAQGKVLAHRNFPRSMANHLQLFLPVELPTGPGILAQNIRSNDSKLIMLDARLTPLWTARLENGLPMLDACTMDWDADGVLEIVVGTLGASRFFKGGPAECSLQVMEMDGTPLYRRRWKGHPLMCLLDTKDIDGDGGVELLIGIGTPEGPAGRYSLAEGTHMHLYVIDPAAVEGT